MSEYFKKNKDMFITIALVVLVDHFLLGGKLREKITTTVSEVLDNCKLKKD